MKSIRQSKILEIIQNSCIETQEELSDRLRAEDFDVTQATISRDIRELMLTKTMSSEGKQRYQAPTPNETQVNERLIRVFKNGVTSIDFACNIIVIKTLVGTAMAVAAALDSMDNKEILGCIAGDDTIFCVVKSEELAIKLIEKLKAI